MDGDGQHPPALVEELVGHWLDDGYDVVYTAKAHRESEPWLRRFRGPHQDCYPMSRRNARKPRQLGISRIFPSLQQAPRLWCWFGLFCVRVQRFGFICNA
jgi:hypothetical protein